MEQWLNDNSGTILTLAVMLMTSGIGVLIRLSVQATKLSIAVDSGTKAADRLAEGLNKAKEEVKQEVNVIHRRIDDLSNRHVDHENRIGHLEGGRDSREHHTQGSGN